MANKITPETAPVGARLLVKADSRFAVLREVIVLEWALSGSAVKLRYVEAGNSWTEELPLLVETLPPTMMRVKFVNVEVAP